MSEEGTTILESGEPAEPVSTSNLSQISDSDLWNEARGRLSDDYKNHPVFQTQKDFETLAKNYMNQNKLVGAKRLEEPQPNWDDAKKDEFWNKLGRPTTSDGYDLQNSGIDYKALNVSDDEIKALEERFHSRRLTKEQAIAEFQDRMETEAKIQAAIQGDTKALLERKNNQITEMFTPEKREQELQLANEFFKSIDDPKLKELVKEEELGNSPGFLKLLNHVAKLMMDDKMIGKGPKFASSTSQGYQETSDPTIRNMGMSKNKSDRLAWEQALAKKHGI